MIRIKETQPFR